MDKAGAAHQLRELVRVLVRNLGILEQNEASCCGTTIGQCHAVVEIGRTEGISLNELADLLNLDKSTMSRTVSNIIDQDLAERETDPSDRRYLKIRLTEQGKIVYGTVENSMDDYFTRVFDSIPEEKHAQVLESLQLLSEAAKENKCCE